MSHIFGNHTSSFIRGGRTGFAGLNNARSIMPGTPICVSGNAGEIVYINMQSVLATKLDQVACMQTVAGKVKVSITLQDPKLATKPDEKIQKGIEWCNEKTLSTKTVYALNESSFTAMKIEFLEDAQFYFYAR